MGSEEFHTAAVLCMVAVEPHKVTGVPRTKVAEYHRVMVPHKAIGVPAEAAEPRTEVGHRTEEIQAEEVGPLQAEAEPRTEEVEEGIAPMVPVQEGTALTAPAQVEGTVPQCSLSSY